MCGTIAHKVFCNDNKSTSEASTLTQGGNAFGTKLARNHKFDSSGLNLAFEGLLLGASLHLHAKGISSDPR
jgi:hypothetical protein